MKYKDFDDWFWEIENYATRGERFLDNFRHMTDREATEWLRTAWACAKGELEKNSD
jgi:hypothetical protein